MDFQQWCEKHSVCIHGFQFILTTGIAVLAVCLSQQSQQDSTGLGEEVAALHRQHGVLEHNFTVIAKRIDTRIADLESKTTELEKRLKMLSTDGLNESILLLEETVMQLRDTTDEAIDDAYRFRNLLNHSASLRSRLTKLEVKLHVPTFGSFNAFDFFPTLNSPNEVFHAGYMVPKGGSLLGKFFPLAQRSGMWPPVSERNAVFFSMNATTVPLVAKLHTEDKWEVPAIAKFPVGSRGVLIVPGNDNVPSGLCYRSGANGYASVNAKFSQLDVGKVNISVVLHKGSKDVLMVLEYKTVQFGGGYVNFAIHNIEVREGDRIYFLVHAIGTNVGSAQSGEVNVTLTPGEKDVAEVAFKKQVVFDMMPIILEQNQGDPQVQLGYTNGKVGERISSFRAFTHESNKWNLNVDSSKLSIFTADGRSYPVIVRSALAEPWTLNAFPVYSGLPPRWFYLHPGSDESDREVGLKYKVRKPGYLQVNATFRSLNNGRKTISVILASVNETGPSEITLRSQLIAGKRALSLTYLQNVKVKSGDLLFFLVDKQENYYGDSTLAYIEVTTSPEELPSVSKTGDIFPYGEFKLSEHFPAATEENSNTMDPVFQLGYADETLPFQNDKFVPFDYSTTTWGDGTEQYKLIVFAKSPGEFPVIARGNPADDDVGSTIYNKYEPLTENVVYLHPGSGQRDGLVGFRFRIRSNGELYIDVDVKSLNDWFEKTLVTLVKGNGDQQVLHNGQTFDNGKDFTSLVLPSSSVSQGDELFIMIGKAGNDNKHSTLCRVKITLRKA